MGKKKYYAVRIGKIPGIYQTWNQAEEQVKGFPSAQYKSFTTMLEAERYMTLESDNNIHENDNEEDINKIIQNKIDELRKDQVIAFVDGSYSPKTDTNGREKYGFGAVLITSKSEVNLFRAYVAKEYMSSANVAGEIEGAKQSILWAIKAQKKELIIYYDYEGIEKWATKEWRAKKKLTKEYSKFYDEKSKLIKIKFKHVKAHSGIEYNERADELAKRSLLSQGYKAYNDGSVYFIGFKVEDWKQIIEEISVESEVLNGSEIKDINISEPKDYLTRISISINSAKVIINCYKGNKSYVQGKQSPLFQKIISCAIEKLPTESSVIETLNAYHALTISESEVENEFNSLLPNFPHDFDDIKQYNNLLSAVFNTMLVGYMPDYTCLLAPVFRAMEYYLHRILHDKLGKNTKTRDGKNKFSYFDKDTTKSRYHYNSRTNGLLEKQIDYLNELYNSYNKVRHPYSHWSLNSIDVQVITDMNVARELISYCLNIINKYYIMF